MNVDSALLKPANSGGTSEASVSRGAPNNVVSATAMGVEESSTVAMTGPSAPAHSVGIVIAHAAAVSLGRIIDAVAAAMIAAPARSAAGATRWCA